MSGLNVVFYVHMPFKQIYIAGVPYIVYFVLFTYIFLTFYTTYFKCVFHEGVKNMALRLTTLNSKCVLFVSNIPDICK